ncbi:PaaI thioesterase [Diaporthe helianthi]|uniref:PaaI thioesterase n=1 Tax=Diaporthe helianthi TaxID=158607 RepID=A0A2P5HYR0_DIAHE|nr:PaaI thioesterase [Diaporthe helianthi]
MCDISGRRLTCLPRSRQQLRIVAAGIGKVTFDLHIHKQHTNRLNILHGGTIASMVDLGGSLAVASMGLYSTGVSTDLNGGRAGDKIRVIAECEKMGKTLAYTHIKFFNGKGDMFARGSHTKFIEKARQDQESLYSLPAWNLSGLSADDHGQERKGLDDQGVRPDEQSEDKPLLEHARTTEMSQLLPCSAALDN